MWFGFREKKLARIAMAREKGFVAVEGILSQGELGVLQERGLNGRVAEVVVRAG